MLSLAPAILAPTMPPACAGSPDAEPCPSPQLMHVEVRLITNMRLQRVDQPGAIAGEHVQRRVAQQAAQPDDVRWTSLGKRGTEGGVARGEVAVQLVQVVHGWSFEVGVVSPRIDRLDFEREDQTRRWSLRVSPLWSLASLVTGVQPHPRAGLR